ncbi:MAG: carbohydrate ABC transporter permease [Thermoanaerobaculia bacterium]
MNGHRAGLLLLFAWVVAPLAWGFLASLTPEAELFDAALAPSHLTAEHYRSLFVERDFLTPIRNSLVVAGATTALALLFGVPAAWALARFEFRGRRTLLALVLAVSVFPQIAIVSPLFLVLRAVRLLDTYPGLVLPYVTFAMPLAIWLLVGYFRQIPREIEEAARADGASTGQILLRIVLPLGAPAIATTAILTFIYCWNEFLFALSFTLGADRQTVPVAIALFRGQYQVPWGEILAAAMVATLPVAAVVLVFQRKIVEGLTAGSVKG